MLITISSPISFFDTRSETETYSQEYYQNIPKKIETVIDAFRAAIFKIEMENISRIPPQPLFSYNISFRDVPEFFTKINSPDVISLYEFLINNDDLIDIISVGCEETAKRLMDNSQLSLEVCNDNSNEYLALYIRQEDYQENLLKIIDEISDKFEGLLVDHSGWFMITTDFDPPYR